MHYDSLVAWTLLGVALSLYIIRKVSVMSASLDRLTDEVAQSRSATNSLTTLVAGMAEQIRDLKDDPAALEALADDLDAQQAEIAAAVTSNTPQDESGATGAGGDTSTDEPLPSGGEGAGDGS